MTLHTDTITGYKVFKKDFTCLNYDFKGVGTIHTFEGVPVLCKSGFHFCTNLEDCFNYYAIDSDMIVCEVQATNYTDAEPDCSKHACQSLTIVRQLTLEEVKSHISTSKNAYTWAKNIGDKDYMKQFVKDSYYAYLWALYIGDREYMKQFVKDSYYAYYWALNIGDREYMKQYVTDSVYAYFWARNIGDREYMKQYVTDSCYAYYWALNIGDREYMKQYISDSAYAYVWAKDIGDKEYMINKFPEIAKWIASAI